MQKNGTTFSAICTPSAYAASRKRFLQGSCSDLQVPYREISLSATRHRDRTEENPPLPVYDASGPYTDPTVQIDLAHGLPDLRGNWIQQRHDTEILSSPSSDYAIQRKMDRLTF